MVRKIRVCVKLELPPRARRIQKTGQLLRLACGTTSACAENTLSGVWIELALRNYLRVRGEYACLGIINDIEQELPPRARRIRVSLMLPPPWHGNYLRVRGEYEVMITRYERDWELPPRARRIP